MRTKLLHEQAGQRTFVVVLDQGDEVTASLTQFAGREGLNGASLSAIGAFERAVLAYFDWEAKDYLHIGVDEQVEVATLLGDIGIDDAGKPALHMHVVLGRRDGSALAGHLKEGHVRPTLEVIVTESPAHLLRRLDEATGLTLIRPES